MHRWQKWGGAHAHPHFWRWGQRGTLDHRTTIGICPAYHMQKGTGLQDGHLSVLCLPHFCCWGNTKLHYPSLAWHNLHNFQVLGKGASNVGKFVMPCMGYWSCSCFTASVEALHISRVSSISFMVPSTMTCTFALDHVTYARIHSDTSGDQPYTRGQDVQLHAVWVWYWSDDPLYLLKRT